MKQFSVILLVLLISCGVYAQPRFQQLNRMLEVLDSGQLAFGNVAIAQDGKLIYQKALGYSSVSGSSKVPSTTNNYYRIGSVSKMFTAVMIFQLIEERKLKLDDRIGLHFAEIPNSEVITIRQLLSHQSGLHDYTKDTGFENWTDQPITQEELVRIIRSKGVDFAPGERNEYSNTNYLVLSYVLEKITGLSYAACLNKSIVSRLRLQETFMATNNTTQGTLSASYKYSENSWKEVRQADPTIHSGAGAIISTPADLTRFIYALFTGKLINQSSLDNMKTISNDYGLGIFSYIHGNQKGFGHNGRIEEFYTSLRYFPESRIAIAYCTNGIHFPRIDIINSLERAAFGEVVVIPFTNNDAEVQRAYTGSYEADYIPIVVDLTIKGDTLVASTQGKEFALEPVSENLYMNSFYRYYLEFFPGKNELHIKETDNVYYLKKKTN